MAHEQKTFQLPVAIITSVDLGRLQRELEALENFLEQAAARESGKSLALPKTTKALEILASDNGLSLLQKDDRDLLKDYLEKIRQRAPVVHMSFAVEPSAAFLKKIITWFRSEIHPLVLLQVGLQPNIAAGCIVRTTNKYFDLSMRKNFQNNRAKLVEKLHTGAAK